jgi:hypothetical protein
MRHKTCRSPVLRPLTFIANQIGLDNGVHFRWLIWDAVVPAASPAPGGQRSDIYLRTKLPSETIEYGCSIARRDRDLDAQYYVSLAQVAGFKFVRLEEQNSPGKTFLLELSKP